MKVGVLSDDHLALLEFEEKSAPSGQLVEPFLSSTCEYLNSATIASLLNQDALVRTLVLDKSTINCSLSRAGKEYLEKRRVAAGYFNIRSEKLRRSLWAILGGLEAGYSAFEHRVLQNHGAITPRGSLTTRGERFAFKALPESLRTFCQTFAWTTEIGPNITFYLGKNWYSDPNFASWRQSLHADWKLVHSVKGIGVTLMDRLRTEHKVYAKLLLQATSFDSLLDSILVSQLRDPNTFIFCNTTDDDMQEMLVRSAGLENAFKPAKSNYSLSMSHVR